MQTRDIGIILLIGLMVISLATASIPYMEEQFFFQNTDLNYTLYKQGYYDQDFLFFDGNTISSKQIDINSYDIDWGSLINFPSGSAGHVTCWKVDGITIGYCSDAPDASGICTCN